MRKIGVSSTLTVYHDGQFWVGTYQRVEDGRLSVCRIVFGMTFVLLFNSGRDPVLLGLISTLVGSLADADLPNIALHCCPLAYRRTRH